MTVAGWAMLAIAPAAIAGLAVPVLAKTRLASRLADHPNERSLHEVPTPRIGGLCLMAAAMPFALAFADDGLLVALVAALFLCALSLVDDARSLPVGLRLSGHVLAAAIVVASVVDANEPAASQLVESIVALLAIVWMTNLFNFMDGADGLAGGMAAIGFASLAIAAALAGQWALAAAALAFASASAGFLVHNFPPARVFMGDAGSVPLGFIAGAFGYLGWKNGAWPLFFPLMAFAPFIADATLTLLKRIVRAEPFWKAHRKHAYQRLALAGWPRRRLAMAAYALMLVSAAAALAALEAGPSLRLGIILCTAAIYLLLFIAIESGVRAS